MLDVKNKLGGVTELQAECSVKAYARLHMGFFDLNGDLGRKFGSIGVALDGPCTEIRAKAADRLIIDARPGVIGAVRAQTIAEKLLTTLGLPGLSLTLLSTIPEHAGLGSGTQMSLAIGTLISHVYGLGLSTQEIAALTLRGGRSGIGVGTFDFGGVILDGGRGPNTVVPPVISRVAFPEAWRILLISDTAHVGVHGQQEVEAFRSLPQFPATIAADLCRHVLMQALPALAEHDLATFGQAIQALQHRTGDHFSPVQGGRYASQDVADVLAWFQSRGALCLGQSSWGPSSFIIFADKEEAEKELITVMKQFSHQENLVFTLCQASNRGSVVND